MAETLPPLDRLDPASSWQPWQPGDKDPWNLKWAAHLYRRAAFGGSPTELKQALERGYQATLDLLLAGQPQAAKLTDFLNNEGVKIAKRYNPNAGFAEYRPEPHEIRAWWLYVMLHSGHPLREKMTLFWHNHFATSIGKIQRAGPMVQQNILLRKHALGKFGPMLADVSKDAAMLLFLDSNSNLKGHPNENFGRELMELFTLGVGNYTEKDVQEVARAFSGWHTDGEKFEFNARYHDDGAKTVLGKKGNFDGGDIFGILLGRDDCARFLVRKLYHFFVSEQERPPDAFIEPLCAQLRKSDYDIAAVMKTILASKHFYSAHAFRQRIKWPVEVVLGAAKTVAATTIPQQALVQRMEGMGQALFAPPNVKGWPAAQAWLNTSTVLARGNFAQAVAMGHLWRESLPNQNQFNRVEAEFTEVIGPDGQPLRPPGLPEEPPPQDQFDPARLVRQAKVEKPEDVVRVLIDAFLPGGLSEVKRGKLIAFVANGNPKGAALDRRVREAVHAILSMPEYQLA